MKEQLQQKHQQEIIRDLKFVFNRIELHTFIDSDDKFIWKDDFQKVFKKFCKDRGIDID